MIILTRIFQTKQKKTKNEQIKINQSIEETKQVKPISKKTK
jgi:hypothetical protein